MNDKHNPASRNIRYHVYNPYTRNGTKFKMLLEATDTESNHIVLDIGCGVGNFDFPLASFVKEIVGTDVSCDALRKANKYRHRLGWKNVHFIAADLNKLPFRNEQFDEAFMIDVLEHVLPTPATSLRDVHRTLRQNAVLFIYTATRSKFSLHYVESLVMGFHGCLWHADREPQHVHRFLPEELIEVISLGFKLKDIKFFGHVFEYLTSILNRLARQFIIGDLDDERVYHSTSTIIDGLYGLLAKIEQIDLALFGQFPSAGVFITFLRT